MINFLKTAVVYIISVAIVFLLFSWLFPNTVRTVLDPESVTVGSVILNFFTPMTCAFITFLILSSDDTLAHVLIICALFELYGWLSNQAGIDASFKDVSFAYVRDVIMTVLAKAIASKIRGAVSRQ